MLRNHIYMLMLESPRISCNTKSDRNPDKKLLEPIIYLMTTKKMSSLLLFSLMVFILVSLPIISGDECTPKGPCEDTKKCNIYCLLLGFKYGGFCDTYGTTFCCCITSKTPPISSLPEH
ncbi:BnaC02g42970D [Brassica napus]|uniref:(rape) hypothetical protein n=1 Tax=Brassica napus TaxID=3708 RepID=A0A078HQA6_BRANA|nr:unnamed protein product [Brassica napus]CDY39821.1 BnaC02g42970D [Brassica napus]